MSFIRCQASSERERKPQQLHGIVLVRDVSRCSQGFAGAADAPVAGTEAAVERRLRSAFVSLVVAAMVCVCLSNTSNALRLQYRWEIMTA